MSEVIKTIAKKKYHKSGKVLKIICISILSVILAVHILIPPFIMKDMIHLHADFKVYSSLDYGVEASEVKLVTDDGFDLVSWEVKADQPKGIVLFLSGIQNPSVTAFFGHAKMLAENGFSSLLIEMRSHGDSEGDKIYLGMKEYLDTKAGVKYVKSKDIYKSVPVIVFGVSMGAATAINSIGEINEIDGLISASAYSTWPDVFCDNMVNMGAPDFWATMEKPFVWLYMGFEYGFGNLKINPLNEIKKLDGRPALLMHSKGDSQVPYISFERLTKATSGNIVTYVCEGDYHFICKQDFDKPSSDRDYTDTILGFLEKNFTK